MPTNKERLDGIDVRLDGIDTRLSQVDMALGLRPPEPKRSFLKQKYEWVISRKGTSLFLAIILCVLGIGGKYWIDHKTEWWNHDVDERINVVLNAGGGIKETLDSVRQTVNRTDDTLNALQPFIHDVITHQFESAAKLPTSLLRERLPAIKDLLTVARAQLVDIDPKVVATLNNKLAQIPPQTSGFWPTAAEFVSFRSRLIAEWSNTNLPPCTNPTPGYSGQFEASPTASPKGEPKTVEMTHGPIEYANCKIVLDSPEASRELSIDLSFADVIFKHCVLVYNGGRIVIFPVRVATKTSAKIIGGFDFKDCLFVLSFSNVPSPQGQQLTLTLLKVRTNTLELKLSEQG